MTLTAVENWYKQSKEEIPRLRDNVALCKMTSFVILIDLPYGEKKVLTPIEACIIALCNGKFTIQNIVQLWQKSIDASFDEALSSVGKTLTEYKYYLVLEEQRRLDDNRYKPADFIFMPRPIVPNYTEPYPYPVEAVFAVTNECNMNCIYCYRSAGESLNNELDTKEWLDILEQSAELGVVRAFITGGEPLLHPGIIKILRRAINKNIYPYMSTNGSLVTPSIVSQLKDVGLDIIQVSLDATTPDIFSKMIDTDIEIHRVEKAIKLFVEAGITVAVKAVITKLNTGEVPRLIERCVELGVNRLSIEGFGLSLGGRGGDELIVDNSEVNRLEMLLSDFRQKYAGKIQLEGFNQAKLWKDSKDIVTCGGMISAFVLQPNGDVVLCENLGDVPELVFGNIRENKLSEIWASDEVLTFLNPDPSEFDSLCQECDNFDACRTGCFNRSLMQYKSIWSPDPFCWKIQSGMGTHNKY